MADRIIRGMTLLQTSRRYPEQYDVYRGGEQVGYMRVRNGNFRVDYPDVGFETVLAANVAGAGEFADEAERTHWLGEGVHALWTRLGRRSDDDA